MNEILNIVQQYHILQTSKGPHNAKLISFQGLGKLNKGR